MQHFDKTGKEIHVGYIIRIGEGNPEEVFATVDADGDDGLGVLATNIIWYMNAIDNGIYPDVEFYPMYNFSRNDIEVVNSDLDLSIPNTFKVEPNLDKAFDTFIRNWRRFFHSDGTMRNVYGFKYNNDTNTISYNPDISDEISRSTIRRLYNLKAITIQ